MINKIRLKMYGYTELKHADRQRTQLLREHGHKETKQEVKALWAKDNDRNLYYAQTMDYNADESRSKLTTEPIIENRRYEHGCTLQQALKVYLTGTYQTLTIPLNINTRERRLQGRAAHNITLHISKETGDNFQIDWIDSMHKSDTFEAAYALMQRHIAKYFTETLTEKDPKITQQIIYYGQQSRWSPMCRAHAMAAYTLIMTKPGTAIDTFIKTEQSDTAAHKNIFRYYFSDYLNGKDAILNQDQLNNMLYADLESKETAAKGLTKDQLDPDKLELIDEDTASHLSEDTIDYENFITINSEYTTKEEDSNAASLLSRIRIFITSLINWVLTIGHRKPERPSIKPHNSEELHSSEIQSGSSQNPIEKSDEKTDELFFNPLSGQGARPDNQGKKATKSKSEKQNIQ